MADWLQELAILKIDENVGTSGRVKTDVFFSNWEAGLGAFESSRPEL